MQYILSIVYVCGFTSQAFGKNPLYPGIQGAIDSRGILLFIISKFLYIFNKIIVYICMYFLSL